MKKNLALALSFLFLVSFVSVVLAEEWVSSEVISNEIVNDSLIQEVDNSIEQDVSNFDVFKARAGLWFAFREEKIAEKELALARLRLAQARKFAKNNNTVAMQKALEEHNRLLEKVQKRIKNIEEKNLSSEKLRGLDRAIQVHELRVERFREKLENSNLTEEQKEKLELALNRSTKSLEGLNQLKKIKEEREVLRLRATQNLSEEEAKKIIENLSKERQEIRQKIEELKKQREEIRVSNKRSR